MDLTAQLTNFRNESRDLPVDQRAKLACELAKRLEKTGEYEAAYEALGEFWRDRSRPPDVFALDDVTKAEVLLRAGALAGWLGAAEQTAASQETAKNIITQSAEIFESLGKTERVAEANGELALCYWREGCYQEARIALHAAISLVPSNNPELKAILLIRAGMVEVDAQRLGEGLRFYNEAAPLVEGIDDHGLKGSFHFEYGLIFRRLSAPENREDYVDRALIEYAASGFHYEQAGNQRAVARVENNLGFLYFTIGQYQDAHQHLDRARDLFLQLKDVGTVAQVDETRARTLLAEDRLREADRTIKAAIKILEKGGQQAVLAEALTTQGTIAARMRNYRKAASLLERAIVVAETVGDREGSGRAHLTIVEELGSHTPLKRLVTVYESATELLDRSQDPATNKRLISCARKVISALLAEEGGVAPSADMTTWEGFSLREEIKKVEKVMIERALRDAGGSVTKAAKLLGFNHHQSLIALIGGRHRDMLPQRSRVRKRRRPLLSDPKRRKKKIDAAQGATSKQLSILHVEDHKMIAHLVEEMLLADGFHVQSCSDGLAAWEILKTDARYDVLVVDNNLPGLSGLELVLRARSIVHRRNLKIIMLSADDVEREAWRAGVDAFLLKSEAITQLTGTIGRIIKERAE